MLSTIIIIISLLFFNKFWNIFFAAIYYTLTKAFFAVFNNWFLKKETPVNRLKFYITETEDRKSSLCYDDFLW